jgi:hypothetical protein
MKLEEKELETLKDQETKKNAILRDLGILALQKQALVNSFATVQSEQEATKKELEEKYGKVSVNLEDGSYEEIKDE